IVVEILDASKADKYQIAILGENGELNWFDLPAGSSRYTFEGLNPGTYYSIYVRLKATQDTLEGVPLIKRINTKYDQHVEDVKDILWDMLTNDENDQTAAWLVIDSIVNSIDKKTEEYPNNPPEEFYTWLEERIAKAEEQLVFARFQDSKIAILEAYCKECVASGSFTDENIARMLSLCSQARAGIIGVQDEDENAVNAIFEPALAEMKAILATYLYSDDYSIKLESLCGLNYGSSITLNSIQDIKALRRAIADAIAQGKITADSFITIEKAQELLRALDTVSAYNFSIINVQLSEGDVFTLTLTIPEALISRTGLQVAYFNQATGMLELLETTREGNTLIFKAKHIADFVILADPNVDLTAVIIALGAILLCQLIAIAFVLISRNKAENSVTHASFALPMFLTVHFLPIANAEFIALGLGIAVVLAQIVLMWLLLSSGMVRVFKIQRTEPPQQKVTAVVREEDLQENPYAAFDEESNEAVEEVLDEVTEEVLDEIAESFIEEATEEAVEEETLAEDAFDEELAQELAYEQDDAYAQDEYAEEVYADEEYAEEAYAESDEEIIEEIFP
ncbi:MAG: fibronectin type III domain-containing protein, partial [Clostridia bacterium]|nr:fibronectin type III domain-containing protein [Clostridia bacterium]